LDDYPIGLGIKTRNDKSNIIGRVGAKLSYSYFLNLNDDNKLSFGVFAGVLANSILFDCIKATNPDEVILQANGNARTTFDAEAGFSYEFRDKLEYVFSAFHLTQAQIRYQHSIADQNLNVNEVPQYLLRLSDLYDFKNSNFAIEPCAMMRSTFGLPVQYEGAIIGIYDEKL
jgi:hypothetical protein